MQTLKILLANIKIPHEYRLDEFDELKMLKILKSCIKLQSIIT